MFDTFNQEGKPTLRLYDQYNQRLYINAEERRRFIANARRADPERKAFALTLAYTGCRISEARCLKGTALQAEARCLSFQSLKQRGKHTIREVPIPEELVASMEDLKTNPNEHIWSHKSKHLPRITAYRWIKEIMQSAQVHGAQACPKGLRHGYGVNATLNGVQIHMLQRWMGHTSIKTTAIYATVLGPDQLKLADRMWRDG